MGGLRGSIMPDNAATGNGRLPPRPRLPINRQNDGAIAPKVCRPFFARGANSQIQRPPRLAIQLYTHIHWHKVEHGKFARRISPSFSRKITIHCRRGARRGTTATRNTKTRVIRHRVLWRSCISRPKGRGPVQNRRANVLEMRRVCTPSPQYSLYCHALRFPFCSAIFEFFFDAMHRISC